MLNIVKDVFAQPPTIAPIPIPTPEGGVRGGIGEWVNTAVNWAVALAALMALMYIILGGFDYITAGDDAKKVAASRTKIQNGVVGLIIVASAFVVWKFMVKLINLTRIFPG